MSFNGNYGVAEGYDDSLYISEVGGRHFVVSHAREVFPVDQIKKIDFYFPEADQVTVYTTHGHLPFKGAEALALRQLFMKRKQKVKPLPPLPASVERGKGKLEMGG